MLNLKLESSMNFNNNNSVINLNGIHEFSLEKNTFNN